MARSQLCGPHRDCDARPEAALIDSKYAVDTEKAGPTKLRQEPETHTQMQHNQEATTELLRQAVLPLLRGNGMLGAPRCAAGRISHRLESISPEGGLEQVRGDGAREEVVRQVPATEAFGICGTFSESVAQNLQRSQGSEPAETCRQTRDTIVSEVSVPNTTDMWAVNMFHADGWRKESAQVPKLL
jgi:hypothetical protein